MNRSDDLLLLSELTKKYETETEKIIEELDLPSNIPEDYAVAVRAMDALIESAALLRIALVIRRKKKLAINNEELIETESMAKVCKTAAAVARATANMYVGTMGLDDEAITEMAMDDKKRFMKVNSKKVLERYEELREQNIREIATLS